MVITEFVCPNLGYREFLHSDWLVQILSWQKPVGCWGMSLHNKDRGLRTRQKQHIPVGNTDNHSEQDINLGPKPPAFRTRQLLYEKTLPGN